MRACPSLEYPREEHARGLERAGNGGHDVTGETATTRRRFWRSSLAMWLLWLALGILLVIGFSLISSSPALIQLIHASAAGI